MNRSEKRLLRRVIYSAAHHNENLWWELKRQVFDFGYELHYPLEYDFESAAKVALKNLSQVEKKALMAEWRRARPARAQLEESQIESAYVRMIIEEIVTRARSAAHRTISW